MSLKDQGNRAFQRRDFKTAERLYTEALQEAGVADGPVLLSNRAAALLSQSEKACDALSRDDCLARAASDAQQCTVQAPTFRRGWMRLAKIRFKQLRFVDACTAVATAVTLESDDGHRDALELASHTLLAAARTSPLYSSVASGTAANEHSDLSCTQCKAFLHHPVTMENGDTVCLPCVPKFKVAVGLEGAAGFGSTPNVVLSQFAEECMPDAARAASLRQIANGFVRDNMPERAVAEYTTALDLAPGDAVIWANRSAARLQLSDATGALSDARMALQLGYSGRAKYREASAHLHAGHVAEAVEAFALASALGEPCAPKLLSSLERLVLPRREETTAPDVVPDTEEESRPGSPERAGRAALPTVCAAVLAAANVHAELPVLRRIDEGKLDKIRAELDCALCYNLLYEPTTLPCGHVICRVCVTRTLDHALDNEPHCPLCRASLSPFVDWLNRRALRQRLSGESYAHGGRQLAITHELARLLTRHFSTEYIQRQQEVESAEAAETGGWVPVFVCSLALPLLPCPLHIFEPRYRLMIRRCVDSGQKRFGMVLPTPSGDGYMDCGTLLRIRSLEQLADGRSKIETIGDRRFRIVERSMRDGYHYCRVEWIDDVAEQLSSAELASQLHNALSNLLARLAAHPLLMQQLEHGCGKLPAADAPEHISFYAISLLSNVQQFEQDLLYELTYLPSVRQRLERLLAIIPTGPAR